MSILQGRLNTGIQSTTVTATLGAGLHTLTLGAFNNKKTFANEESFVSFDDVVVRSVNSGPGPRTVQLVAKGVNFGAITAHPDGTVDTANVHGVDADLRVRPFFHQGGTVSMREFIVGAFNDEMGLQVVDPILCSVTDPNNPQAMTSPAGFAYDPTVDTFERPKACDPIEDPDSDGVVNEIDAALLDHMEFYLLNYFKPGQYRVSQRVADVETVYDPDNGGIFNQLFATAGTRFGEAIDDGDPFPQLPPSGEPFVVNNFYSDLKRHDLGPNFHEREFDDGINNSRVTEFVTEPLWGVGSTAPYGHDGRSINLDQVIRRHGGEAQNVTDAYIALSEDDQQKVQEFLQTLILFPPDDTASNLNPGNPTTDNPQLPSEHGSILLPVLFQIPDEQIGGE